MTMTDKDLRDYLNFTVRDMTNFRRDRLVKGEDYVWVRDRLQYEYTVPGVKKVCAILNVPVPDLASPAAPAPVEPEFVDLVIERVCPNPTWVRCRLDGGLVDVRVRNNAAMFRGKRIRALHDGRNYVAVRVAG